MNDQNFTAVYRYVSAQSEGATIPATASATLLSEAEIASFFAEPSAFNFDGTTATAVDTYVIPSAEVRVAVDSLAELFPDPEATIPETDELADFISNYELSPALLSDLEYTVRNTGVELEELATKYGVDTSNASFTLVRQKLAVSAALIHNLRMQGAAATA